MNIYLASSWRNEYQPHLLATLRAEGHKVFDFKEQPPVWTSGGEAGDPDEVFNIDMAALHNTNMLVLLLPAGASAHVEAGYLHGKGVPVIVHMPESCEPELMYKMFESITTTEDELLEALL